MFVKKKIKESIDSPKWIKFKLSFNYIEALAQIEEILQKWPRIFVNLNKLRLLNMFQYMIKSHFFKKKMNFYIHKELKNKEKKFSYQLLKKSRKIDKYSLLKATLLERLKSGSYGNIYNFKNVQNTKYINFKKIFIYCRNNIKKNFLFR